MGTSSWLPEKYLINGITVKDMLFSLDFFQIYFQLVEWFNLQLTHTQYSSSLRYIYKIGKVEEVHAFTR